MEASRLDEIARLENHVVAGGFLLMGDFLLRFHQPVVLGKNEDGARTLMGGLLELAQDVVPSAKIPIPISDAQALAFQMIGDRIGDLLCVAAIAEEDIMPGLELFPPVLQTTVES